MDACQHIYSNSSYLYASVYSNTNRWQHTPHRQPDNNKCVREERFPPAETGCVQTWGFIQSCDPAPLLLISYVIPISAMCSHHNHWPEYVNCDQLPAEVDIFPPLAVWRIDDRGDLGWCWTLVTPWRNESLLNYMVDSPAYTHAFVHKACGSQMQLSHHFLICSVWRKKSHCFVHCAWSLKLKGVLWDQFTHTEEVTAITHALEKISKSQ